MNSRPNGAGLLLAGLLALAGAAVLAWLWRCWCLFPGHAWNEIRLAPLYWWRQGSSIYPDPATGPATTWIYGPLPLLLMAPVVLMHSASGALELAGALNLAGTAGAIAVVCGCWPAEPDRINRIARVAGFLCCLAVWPSENLRFFQADNAAVAFGLLSLLALRCAAPGKAGWPAAALGVAAVLCKQTLLGLVLAECAYVLVRAGARPAFRFGLRIAALLLIAGAVMAFAFGAKGVWYCLVTLPSRLPWADSFSQRLLAFWPQLFLHAAIPVALLAVSRARFWRRDSPWLLPALAWIAMAPWDIAALLKTGGSVNSLHGTLLFLPPALVGLLSIRRFRLAPALLSAVAIIAALAHMGRIGPGAWQPRTEHLRQAGALVRHWPQALYFPWHPLVSFYAEHRIDEIEDGLFIRQLAGDPVPVDRAHLPPRFDAMAFQRGSLDWGIARRLIPARRLRIESGAWTIYQWSPAPRRIPPSS